MDKSNFKLDILLIIYIICIFAFLSIFKICQGKTNDKLQKPENFNETEYEYFTLGRGLENTDIGDLTDIVAIDKEFAEIFSRIDEIFTAEYIKQLSQYKVILVPGLFADIYSKKRKFMLFRWYGDKYFHDQLRWFETNQIENEILQLDSQNFTNDNLKKIVQAIEQSKKPVIILAHSKGGIEVLNALTLKPSVAKNVKGFIALQVPFKGTPLADYWLKKAYLMTLTMLYFNITGASKDTIENLTTQKRNKFLSDNKRHIEQITKNIPFLCVGTWKPKDPFKINTGLWFTRRFLLKMGYERNDGYTPVDYTLINRCRYVFIKNVDHRQTVLTTSDNSIDRIKLTKTLLFLFLQKIMS